MVEMMLVMAVGMSQGVAKVAAWQEVLLGRGGGRRCERCCRGGCTRFTIRAAVYVGSYNLTCKRPRRLAASCYSPVTGPGFATLLKLDADTVAMPRGPGPPLPTPQLGCQPAAALHVIACNCNGYLHQMMCNAATGWYKLAQRARAAPRVTVLSPSLTRGA